MAPPRWSVRVLLAAVLGVVTADAAASRSRSRHPSRSPPRHLSSEHPYHVLHDDCEENDDDDWAGAGGGGYVPYDRRRRVERQKCAGGAKGGKAATGASEAAGAAKSSKAKSGKGIKSSKASRGGGGYGVDMYGAAFAPYPVPPPGAPSDGGGGYDTYPYNPYPYWIYRPRPSSGSSSGSMDGLRGDYYYDDDDEEDAGGSWFVDPDDEGSGYDPYPIDPEPTEQPALTRRAACNALRNGNVVRTSRSASMEYAYEASVREDAAVGRVTVRMARGVARLLGAELMECEEAGDGGGSGRALRRGTEIVGVYSDQEVWGGAECAYFTGDKAMEEAECHVIKGGIMLYLGEHEWRKMRTRTLLNINARELEEEITQRALDVIKEAMNQETTSPFLEHSEEEEYAVPGLMGVHFVAGFPTSVAAAAKDAEDSGRSAKLKTAGISLLAIGSSALAALALAMVAVRKRRSRLDDSYNEFRDSDSVLDGGSEKATEIDDELSLTDLSPTRDVVATPPREGKVAYVVGEEESLYTSAAEARRLAEISFTRVESGNDNSDDHQVDVHRCASATCQICEGRGMTFVGLYEEAATAEGHEFSYRGPYEPRDDATAPEYDNPAALARTYVVEDTVEF